MAQRNTLSINVHVQQHQVHDRPPLNYPLLFEAATTLDHVEMAWKLVYERYFASGLIGANPFGIHCSRHAIHRDACVVVGKCSESGRALATMTLIADSRDGLSLDSVFRRELNRLRAAGRGLLEVGLLVTDCAAGSRSDMTALFEMMKWAAYYARHMNLSDVVVGVHPHHVKFYTRCYGFEQFGAETVYPMVKNKPVVPLRLRLNEQLALQVLPRGLRHVRDYPLHADAFSNRYPFCNDKIRGTLIDHFMLSLRKPKGGLASLLRQPRLWNSFRGLFAGAAAG